MPSKQNLHIQDHKNLNRAFSLRFGSATKSFEGGNLEMSISPRSAETLDHTRLWDEGCVKSFIEETTKNLIEIYSLEDMRAMAMKQKRAFQPVTPYPLSEVEVRDKFYEKAKQEALKILEQERKNYVAFHSDRFKKIISQIIKQLQFLVYYVDENGKPQKGKIIVERKVVLDDVAKGTWIERDMQYFEIYTAEGIERVNQISGVMARLNELSDYIAYGDIELQELYRQALDLQPEIIWEKKKDVKA